MDVDAWLAEATGEVAGPEAPVAPACTYCTGYCVHDVAGERESGLRFAYSTLVDVGIPPRFEQADEPSYWSHDEPRVFEPASIMLVRSADGQREMRGVAGGKSRSAVSRGGGTVKRSQAGVLLSKWRRGDALTLAESEALRAAGLLK